MFLHFHRGRKRGKREIVKPCFFVLRRRTLTFGAALLMAGIAALIVAFIVVGALTSQLKQAVQQSAATNYVRKDSFHLNAKFDHFLYETTERKKIEQQKKAE